MKNLYNSIYCSRFVKHILFCFITFCWPFHQSIAGNVEVTSAYVFDVNNNRPRLYITDQKIKDLRESLLKKPYSKYWKYIKTISNRTLDKQYFNKNDYQGSNYIRVIGDRLPYLALAYLLTDEKKYYDGIVEISRYLLELNKWGSNKDIGAAHIIFGLSIVYDWLHDELPKELTASIKNSLVTHTRILNTELVNKKIWWAREHSLLQNHNYINVMAIAIAGVTLYGDTPDAEEWLANAKVNFNEVSRLLSPDGASHEGVAYWSYGMDALLKYYEGVSGFIEDEGVTEIDYFKNAITYRLHMSLPGFAKTANYSDSPEHDYKGPGYILRLLASRFNDGRGQWLAEKIEVSRKHNSYSWLDLLWYDENNKAIPPTDSDTNYFFSNLGILVSRSGWGEGSSWLLFKAGSSQGEHALNHGIYAGSHIHPDAGHFSLWSEGEWVFNDEGYSLLKKSENHNVILVDGEGQSGEGRRWFDRKKAERNKSQSKIVKSNVSDNQAVVSVQLSGVYSPDSNLNSWNRSFHIVDKDSYVIHDTILVDRQTKVNSLIHSQKPITKLSKDLFCTGGYYLKIISQLPIMSKNSLYTIPVSERRNNKGIYSGWLLDNELHLSDKSEVIYVISPAYGACDAKNYRLNLDDETLSYKTGEKQWRLNMANDVNPNLK